jgi:hypothetical protein
MHGVVGNVLGISLPYQTEITHPLGARKYACMHPESHIKSQLTHKRSILFIHVDIAKRFRARYLPLCYDTLFLHAHQLSRHSHVELLRRTSHGRVRSAADPVHDNDHSHDRGGVDARADDEAEHVVSERGGRPGRHGGVLP